MLTVRFRGKQSAAKSMPGSTPQGTLFGVVLFLLYVNPIAFLGEITLQVGEILTNYWENLELPFVSESKILKHQQKQLTTGLQSVKYCDDVTVQEVININTALACNIDRSGPLPWWESSGKVLPKGNSLLQTEIESLKRISDNREMILNAKKTCLFVVNFTENHQFRPLLALPGESDALQVVFETKLLGYWLTSDMKPSLHVEFIVKKCISRLWTIRQLKKTGVCNTDITKFYTTMIRSVLETNCVVFNSMLTQQEEEDIE